MEKRYQVFISSTYTDLKEERSRVIQTLMEMDCIPAGMELFPAADEEQFEFIKKVINDCDYYLLIVAARYGSTTSDGISYTEKEYDYAVERGLKVIALIHEAPDQLPVAKAETSTEKNDLLSAFRQKVMTGRMVRFWKSPDQLPGLVALSLGKTIKTHPAIGWVRGNTIAGLEILSEVNELRKQNLTLKEQLARKDSVGHARIADLAPLDTKLRITGRHQIFEDDDDSWQAWEQDTTWATVFGLLGPEILVPKKGSEVERALARLLRDEHQIYGFEVTLDHKCFQTIKIQMLAYGFISIQKPDVWQLTELGTSTVFELRAIRAGTTE